TARWSPGPGPASTSASALSAPAARSSARPLPDDRRGASETARSVRHGSFERLHSVRSRVDMRLMATTWPACGRLLMSSSSPHPRRRETRARRRLRREDGQAMVEFAIGAPILIVILLGIMQFGAVYHDWTALTDAARAGARTAAESRASATRNTDAVNAVKASAKDLNA